MTLGREDCLTGAIQAARGSQGVKLGSPGMEKLGQGSAGPRVFVWFVYDFGIRTTVSLP